MKKKVMTILGIGYLMVNVVGYSDFMVRTTGVGLTSLSLMAQTAMVGISKSPFVGEEGRGQ